MRMVLTVLLLLAGSVAVAQQSGQQRNDAVAAAQAAAPQAPQPPSAPPAAAPESAAVDPAVEPVVASATVADAAVTEVLAQVPVAGTLVPRQEVQIYPQVSGFEIVDILVEAGDEVRAGQVLARLSDETLTAQLAQAAAEFQRAEAGVSQARSQIASTEAALNQAVAALDRTTRLQRSGSTTQAALDQAISAEAAARAAATSASDGLAVAQAQLAQAGAARDIARLNLARTEIIAPVPGVISIRNAELGALAGGGDPLFVLVARSEIDLAAEVIETALPQIEVGDPAVASVAGVGEVEGEVRLIPARVDPVTRLGVLRIALRDGGHLTPGLFASALVTTERREGLTVPATAVSSEGGASHVLVVRDGRVERREVDAGLIWKGRREILGGLAQGETVIARAGAFFRDGDPVNPVQLEDGAEDGP